MNVLVDTSIWSLALRRHKTVSKEAMELSRLIQEGRTEIIGPIRQELLSGIPDHQQFQLLQSRLAVFPDIPLRTDHFELAAEFNNKCRKKGVQGSHTDFLISSVANLEKLSIFTSDGDFAHFSRYIPLTLYHSRRQSGRKETH